MTGAWHLAGMGVSIALIQLMARWSSDVVLRYVAESPLRGLSDVVRRGAAAAPLGHTVQELAAQVDSLTEGAVEDRRMMVYLREELELAKAREVPPPARVRRLKEISPAIRLEVCPKVARSPGVGRTPRAASPLDWWVLPVMRWGRLKSYQLRYPSSWGRCRSVIRRPLH